MYATKQKIANQLVSFSSKTQQSGRDTYEMFYEEVAKMLDAVIENGGFAAQVATTVRSKMNIYGYQVAYISDKQAWIIACAIVENNLLAEKVAETEKEASKEEAKAEQKKEQATSKIAANKEASSDVLAFVKSNGKKLTDYYQFVKNNKRYAREFFSKKFSMESAQEFVTC